jgi:hypothetical protein
MTGSGPDASKSVVTDKGQAQIVADLLGVNSAALEAALTSRLMEIRYGYHLPASLIASNP